MNETNPNTDGDDDTEHGNDEAVSQTSPAAAQEALETMMDDKLAKWEKNFLAKQKVTPEAEKDFIGDFEDIGRSLTTSMEWMACRWIDNASRSCTLRRATATDRP